MNTKPATPRWQIILPLVLAALAGVLLFSYNAALANLAYRWSHEPDYSHGFFVPLVALVLLWVRRARLGSEPLVGNWWGLVGLALSVLLRLAGEFYYYALLHPISLLPALAGLCVLIGGRRMLVWAAPSILFLVFMIPLPEFLRQGVSLPLQRVSTLLSVGVLQTLGQPAVAEGNTILIDDFRMEVVAACSGLRLLVALAALVTGYALFLDRPWREKLLLLLCVLPVAVVANVVRLVATGLMFQGASEEATQRMVHDGAGWIMIPLAVLLIALVGLVIRHLFPSEQEVRAVAVNDESLWRTSWRNARWSVNWRLAWSLLVGVSAALLVVILVRYWQIGRMATGFHQAAGRAEANRDWNSAARELRRYLRLRPDDVDARIRLATTFDKVPGSTTHDIEAVDLYRQAILVAPGRIDLRHRQLELLLKLGRSVDAQREADRLQAIDSQDKVAQRARAFARFMQWRAGRAISTTALVSELNSALKAHPGDESLITALNTVEVRQRLAKNPLENPKGRPRDLRALLKSGTVGDRLQLAMGLLKRSEFTAAESQLREALKQAPDDVRCHLTWIAFLKQTGRQPEAKAALAEFQANVKVADDLQAWMLAQAYELLGEEAQARDYYLAALAKRPQDNQLQQQVVLFFVDQEVVKAESGLRAALAVSPKSALLRQALALQLAKRTDDAAQQEAQDLVREQLAPGDLRVLATILLDRDNPTHWSDAMALLESIPAGKRSTTDRLLLSRAYRQVGRETDAVKILGALAADPAVTEAQLSAYLDAMLAARELNESRELDGVLKQAATRFPNNVELQFRIATYRFRQRRTDEAKRLYQRVLELEPRHLAAINNLALLLSEQPQGTGDALRLLELATKRTLDPTQSLTSAATAEDAYRLIPLEDTRAMVLLRHGDPQGAVQLLEMLVLRPQVDPNCWLHLALAYEQLGETEKARQALAKAGNQSLAKQWLTPVELQRLSALETK